MYHRITVRFVFILILFLFFQRSVAELFIYINWKKNSKNNIKGEWSYQSKKFQRQVNMMMAHWTTASIQFTRVARSPSLFASRFHPRATTTIPHRCIRLLLRNSSPNEIFSLYSKQFSPTKLGTLHYDTHNSIREKILLLISSWFYWASNYVCPEYPRRRDVKLFPSRRILFPIYCLKLYNNRRRKYLEERDFESKNLARKCENGISLDFLLFLHFLIIARFRIKIRIIISSHLILLR